MSPGSDGDLSFVLSHFGGDPQRTEGLAAFLGFEPIPSPEDRLAGALQGDLRRYIRGRYESNFGVSELYLVGRRETVAGSVGLWVAVLSDWGHRSSDRDRARRRVARGLVRYENDRRTLTLLVPPATDNRQEAELIFPRTQAGGSRDAVTTVRAHLDLAKPSRFHRDLLRGLRVQSGAGLLEITRQWQQQFSVERVTTRFYMEYADVRNRIADALRAHNKDHPEVKDFTLDDARAWATRQMGRVLFLWFLQAKRWLGEPYGQGSVTYLPDLWDKRPGDYFNTILEPLFFDALATGSSGGESAVLGYVPYLNGGLFRRNAAEDRIAEAGPVSLPDEVFDPRDDNSLLGLLSRYHFVTRESTPDDQSVDPDPELLGRVFENLYQGDERHDTGTYYTPREIVHFMCREALDGYLRDEAEVEQGTLDKLRQVGVGTDDEQESPGRFPASRLIDALENVRICDPAVGSGAFLMGAIQEIVALRRGILHSRRRHVELDEIYQEVSDWKRHTIERCLHGVDINPEAVEICRLRLWLSMVLDMDEPPEPDSGWALPNLDFQIVAGDSLVDRLPGVVFKESWPPPDGLQLDMGVQNNLRRLENNIARWRAEFTGTHRDPGRLRVLRDNIARDQGEVVRVHIKDARNKAEAEAKEFLDRKKPPKTKVKAAQARAERMRDLLDSLDSKNFALVQKPFLWPIAFPDVFREGGFDIVLANPPYVRMEKLDDEDEKTYIEAFSEVAASRADILVYFYARAVQILRPGGWMSFITSNSFTKRKYGTNLRGYLPNTLTIDRVIDFGEVKIFDATVEPYVLVSHKTTPEPGSVVLGHNLFAPLTRALGGKGNVERVRAEIQELPEYLDSEVSSFPQSRLTETEWRIEDEAVNLLFERLMNLGTPLGEFVKGRIYMGVKTGLNKAFVINEDKRRELIGEDRSSAELIKPWLEGKDIRRWKADSSDLYIIFTNRGVDISKYPAIQGHLRWFRDELEERATAHLHPWYELQQPQEGIYHEYARAKIVWPEFARSIRFTFDPEGSYVNNKCYVIPVDNKGLLAVLNASLSEFLLCQMTNSLPGGFTQLYLHSVSRLPIVSLDEDAQAELEILASEILSLEDSPKQVEAIEREIDSIVFHVYGLSAPERKLVLDWLGERREALGAEMPPDWRKLNALRATAGAWRDSIDGDKLIEDIHASRLINTRPEPRL